MSNEEIKLFTDLMGYEKCDRCEDCGMLKLGDEYLLKSGLKFSTSWSSIMPVVEKIGPLNFEIIICTWKTEIFSKDFPYESESFESVDKTGNSPMIILCYNAKYRVSKMA